MAEATVCTFVRGCVNAMVALSTDRLHLMHPIPAILAAKPSKPCEVDIQPTLPAATDALLLGAISSHIISSDPARHLQSLNFARTTTPWHFGSWTVYTVPAPMQIEVRSQM